MAIRRPFFTVSRPLQEKIASARIRDFLLEKGRLRPFTDGIIQTKSPNNVLKQMEQDDDACAWDMLKAGSTSTTQASSKQKKDMLKHVQKSAKKKKR